jgi:hypothetical protein
MTAAILIKTRCPKCGKPHEILIPTHQIEEYLNKTNKEKIIKMNLIKIYQSL